MSNLKVTVAFHLESEPGCKPAYVHDCGGSIGDPHPNLLSLFVCRGETSLWSLRTLRTELCQDSSQQPWFQYPFLSQLDIHIRWRIRSQPQLLWPMLLIISLYQHPRLHILMYQLNTYPNHTSHTHRWQQGRNPLDCLQLCLLDSLDIHIIAQNDRTCVLEVTRLILQLWLYFIKLKTYALLTVMRYKSHYWAELCGRFGPSNPSTTCVRKIGLLNEGASHHAIGASYEKNGEINLTSFQTII